MKNVFKILYSKYFIKCNLKLFKYFYINTLLFFQIRTKTVQHYSFRIIEYFGIEIGEVLTSVGSLFIFYHFNV